MTTLTLRTRFALTVAIVAALATTTAAALSYQSIHDRLDRAVDDSVRAGAVRTAARVVRDQRFSGRPIGRDANPRGGGRGNGNPGYVALQHVDRGDVGLAELSEELLIIQLIDRSGTRIQVGGQVALPIRDSDTVIFASRAAEPPPEPVPGTPVDFGLSTLRTVRIDGSRYRIATLPVPGFGGVQAGRNVEETSEVLEDLLRRLAILVGLTSLTAAAVGWMLARKATQRLQSLTSVATAIADTGDLRTSTKVASGGSDETAQLAAAFDRMISALATSREQQHRLVQDASHELRTPLTSLRTNLEVLPKFNRLSPDDQGRLVSDVRLEVEELVLLVDELVDHATEARGDQAAEDLMLREVAQRCIDRVTRRTLRTINLHADESVVRVPPGSAERAILNLLNNAVKFSPQGSVIDVNITNGSTTVTDQGKGIAPEDLTRVFDRFYRATDKHELPGSGLGLSIVAETAHRWGGTVSAANVEPHGAAVSVSFPIARP